MFCQDLGLAAQFEIPPGKATAPNLVTLRHPQPMLRDTGASLRSSSMQPQRIWGCILRTCHVPIVRGEIDRYRLGHKDYSLRGNYCLTNSPSGNLCNFIARFAENDFPRESDM